MFRVLFLAKIIVVCISADLPIILCFHFPDFFIQFSRYTAVSSLRFGTCLQFVACAPNLPCFLPFQEVVGSMWTVRLSLPAFVDSPHCAFPFGEAVFTTSLVGSSGLEPPTSRLSGVRSNHLSYEPISLVPRRLVPRPLFRCFPWLSLPPRRLPCGSLSLQRVLPPAQPVVEMNRFELSTPCLQGRCSPI